MKTLSSVWMIIGALSCAAASQAHADARVFDLRNPPPGVLASPGQTPAASALSAAAGSAPQASYTLTVNSPTIYKKNIVYVTPFPLPVHSAGNAVISNVAWQYSTQARMVGFEAALCWKNQKTCVSVDKLNSGQTSEFNGLDALQPFLLIYQVVGTGALTPAISGGPAQILVTYRATP